MAFRPAVFRYDGEGAQPYIALPPGHKAWTFELSGPSGSTCEFRVETANAEFSDPLVQRSFTLDDSKRVEGLVTEEAFKKARVVIVALTGSGAALSGSLAFQ